MSFFDATRQILDDFFLLPTPQFFYNSRNIWCNATSNDVTQHVDYSNNIFVVETQFTIQSHNFILPSIQIPDALMNSNYSLSKLNYLPPITSLEKHSDNTVALTNALAVLPYYFLVFNNYKLHRMNLDDKDYLVKPRCRKCGFNINFRDLMKTDERIYQK